MIHLVYCNNVGKKGSRELDLILDLKKTMVVRGAAGRKFPHSRVFAGEILYFMEKGTSLITAKAIVKQVFNYVKLSDEEITKTLLESNDKLCLTDKELERWHKKCLCLVEFGDVEPIEPMPFAHQNNMDDWLILENIEDVVDGTSKDFNYDNFRINLKK